MSDSVRASLVLNMVGRVAIAASGALITILLARHYQAEVFGQWSVALVFGQLVGTFVEGGLGRVLMRDAARSPENAGKALGLTLKGRGLLGALSIPIALIAAWTMTPSWEGWLLILLLVLSRYVEGLQSSFQSVLFALGKFRATNVLEVARRMVRLVGIAIVVAMGASLNWAAVVTLAVMVVSSIILFQITQREVRIEWAGRLRDYWKDAFWFWLSGILFWINAEIDQLMLADLEGEYATGIYAASVRLVMLSLIVPRFVSDSLIPRLFRSGGEGRGLTKDLGATLMMLSTIGATVGVTLWYLGQPVVEFVYSEGFVESGPVLAVLGVFLALHFARAPASWFLATSDRVRLNTGLMGAACLVNVLANLVLIPELGPVGAAWATCLSEAVLAVLTLGIVVKLTSPRLLVAVGIGVSPALVLLAAFHMSADVLPWYASAALAALFSTSILWMIGRQLGKDWNPLGVFGR